MAPGTVIISAAAEVSDVRKVVSPVVQNKKNTTLVYVDFSNSPLALGGSAFAQMLGSVGSDVLPRIDSAEYFARHLPLFSRLSTKARCLCDVSAGGLVTTLLEMTFANTKGGLNINLDGFDDKDVVKLLFAENSAVVMQVENKNLKAVEAAVDGLHAVAIGTVQDERVVLVSNLGCSICSTLIICATCGSSHRICSTAVRAARHVRKSVLRTIRSSLYAINCRRISKARLPLTDLPATAASDRHQGCHYPREGRERRPRDGIFALSRRL